MTQSRLEKFGRLLIRLGCLLPLTPWPAILYIQSFGECSTGRHSATALMPVAGNLLQINLLWLVVGILLVRCGRAEVHVKAWLIATIVTHFFLICGYVFENAAIYV